MLVCYRLRIGKAAICCQLPQQIHGQPIRRWLPSNDWLKNAGTKGEERDRRKENKAGRAVTPTSRFASPQAGTAVPISVLTHTRYQATCSLVSTQTHTRYTLHHTPSYRHTMATYRHTMAIIHTRIDTYEHTHLNMS